MEVLDTETVIEESQPFKTLTELYDSLNNLTQWPEIIELRNTTEYVYKGSDIHLQGEPLQRVHRESQPKTIVCHDMKGGYIEDRFINGSTTHDAYVFYHWSIVDTFIYFSHHFVTVPPYGWINAAHTHGVKILGTVITEHTDGAKIWDKILVSKETVEEFANALITIAKFYQFEGWLLNIENKIKLEQIPILIYFVNFLSDQIHKEINGSEIIWYDSVINTGELIWQNELNEKNKDFFLSCDGIFLNYNWDESRLANSNILTKNLNRNVHDIYVGLDVWGRGCPGGGGFNSAHALEKIREQNLSVAIFAPGWTHEYFGPKTFYQLEDIFWAQLFPYLYVHVPIYDKEKFQTSFCRGTGPTYYHFGQKWLEMQFTRGRPYFKEKCFYNLSMQQPQVSVPSPTLKFIALPQQKEILEDSKSKTQPISEKFVEVVYENEGYILRICKNVVNIESKLDTTNINCFELWRTFSYEGGGCLKLITKHSKTYHRLFLTHVDLQSEIQVSIIYGEENPSAGSNEPILVLGDSSRLSFLPATKSSTINEKWKRCIYITHFKVVNEIGIQFPRKGNCYLGEIVLEPRGQLRFDDDGKPRQNIRPRRQSDTPELAF